MLIMELVRIINQLNEIERDLTDALDEDIPSGIRKMIKEKREVIHKLYQALLCMQINIDSTIKFELDEADKIIQEYYE